MEAASGPQYGIDLYLTFFPAPIIHRFIGFPFYFGKTIRMFYVIVNRYISMWSKSVESNYSICKSKICRLNHTNALRQSADQHLFLMCSLFTNGNKVVPKDKKKYQSKQSIWRNLEQRCWLQALICGTHRCAHLTLSVHHRFRCVRVEKNISTVNWINRWCKIACALLSEFCQSR